MATQIYKKWLSTDQKFMDEMKQITQIFIENGTVYIDTHDNNEKILNKINVCCDVNNSLKWCFPGGYRSIQCKNPLFVYKNKVYLSTESKGFTLNREDNKFLYNDRIYSQSNEINISLDIDDFINCVSKN